MSPNPGHFLEHLRSRGYHPRSDKHSNSLSECIVEDLYGNCPAIRKKSALGELVYDLNFTLRSGSSDWKVDLVLGEPPLEFRPEKDLPGVPRHSPSRVSIAIEIKSVMTEHNKAIRNRKRDFEAHHGHVHAYDPNAIAGAVLVVNGSRTFQSPLRSGITEHREPTALVKLCVDQIRAVTQRNDVRDSGLDAKTVIVVDMDNMDMARTAFLVKPPAPVVGDPLHYDAFIQTLCGIYTTRFAR